MTSQTKTIWRKVKLGEVANFHIGGTPSRSVGEYWGGNIKWISIQDIVSLGGHYISNTSETIAEAGLRNSAAKVLPKDSIIISARGTVGALAMLAEPMAFNQSCYGITVKDAAILDATYLLYVLKNAVVYLKKRAHGGVFSTVTMDTLHDLEIHVPEKGEQIRIAKILNAFDDKIEVNNKICENLEKTARAIFKEWFVDFRFAGHEKAEFVDSELGRIPKGWEVVSLKEIVENILDRYQGDNERDQLPYVPIDVISSRSLALRMTAPPEEAKSSLIKFQQDDILFGAMRAYFHKAAIAPFGGLTRTTCFVLRSKFTWLAPFSAVLISQKDVVSYATSHSVGSTIPYAKWDGSLAEFSFVLPPRDILEKFNQIVSPMIGRWKMHLKMQGDLEKNRDTLLPKLMNGTLRV